MTRDALAALLEAYRDGVIDAASARQLAEAIARDDDDARWLLGELALSGRLAQAHERIDDDRFAAGLAERLRAERSASAFVRRVDRAIRPPRRWWSGALAAAALIVAAIWLWSARREPADAVVLAARGAIDLAVGAVVPRESAIAVPRDGELVLGYPDGTRLELAGGSAFLLRAGSAKRLGFGPGSLRAEVRPQGEHALRIETPHAQVAVVGTRFALEVRGDDTRLDVAQGVVRLAGRGGELAVGAGQSAIARRDAPVRLIDDTDGVGRRFHVSPRGSDTGDGSAERPWDLATALAQPTAVAAGDTILLHGGTYAGAFVSRLRGTLDRPITVRGAPGERAVIDGATSREPTLTVDGGWTDYRDIELVDSDPRRRLAAGEERPFAIVARGPRDRFIDLVVHGAGGGIALWQEAVDDEVVGCLVFDCGWVAPGGPTGHGISLQNERGAKSIRGCAVFANLGYGIQAFGSPRAHLDHLRVDGDIVFGNPVLIGGECAVDDLVFAGNHVWNDARATGVALGYGDTANGQATIDGNVLVGGAPVLAVGRWRGLTVRDNALIQPGDGALVACADGGTAPGWDGNRFDAGGAGAPFAIAGEAMAFARWRDAGFARGGRFGPAPPGAAPVIVRRDEFARHRAFLLVDDAAGRDALAVDLRDVLAPGRRFAIHDVVDLERPIVTGTYDGAAVSLPLAPATATPPIGDVAAPAMPVGPRLFLVVGE